MNPFKDIPDDANYESEDQAQAEWEFAFGPVWVATPEFPMDFACDEFFYQEDMKAGRDLPF